ncbi:tyrosine-type recombinase/integrase [Streptomyces sp. NBC_01092]|uniref:tyrosine-type recombinase/integrase n=1 Tax=Streptomyces sp. NBC_01092 TaxID=2903748 RepID=UPI00386EB585|nr:site-specific integrase [Streptomyces sp. NBC_01092]
MGLTVVRDLRDARQPTTAEELERFETDALAGFILARAAAGTADTTISNDIGDLQQMRDWFGRPLWEMEPPDADAYFGREVRHLAPTTRRGKADALSVYFQYLELRHAVEIHSLTGIVVECPLDELNRQRGSTQLLIRIPPSEREISMLFQGWACDLQTCRKFATGARNFAAAQLMSQVGLRITECRCLSLDDIKWEVGRFGKVHVRYGKGSRGAGPKQRLVPLINGARATAQWYVEDVRGYFDDEWSRPGAPLLPSERKNTDGTSKQVSSQSLRDGLNEAVERHLHSWTGRLTPHVLRHFCASQMYLAGMDLLAIQELLGHSWIATTMRYVHVQRTHIEDAWLRGQQRAAQRLEGLIP